jgi:hypothetical protein
MMSASWESQQAQKLSIDTCFAFCSPTQQLIQQNLRRLKLYCDLSSKAGATGWME